MRLLVAGRNAKAVARAAGAFADDLTIETVATKAAAIALLERAQFDLILACEKLGDGLGLEVLSRAAVNAPNTLRIFAARPSTLNLLKGDLGMFGLFRTLPYPINFRNVWSAIDLAHSCCVESELSPQARKQVPRVPHVVLDNAWEAQTPGPTTLKPNTPVVSPRSPAPAGASRGPCPPTRIPESEAFKRALARRNEVKRRRNLSVSTESLAQLAQLATIRRSTLDSRVTPGGLKRTALFVGAGVFAAGTATFLTFFMVSSNNSVGRSALPLAASSNWSVSQNVLPWQEPTPQPTPTTFAPSDTVAPTTADMDMDVEAEAEAEAEAGFEPFGHEPGYPGLRPPNPLQGPPKPPSYDASGLPIGQ